MNRVGRYRGIKYRQQRICDVLAVGIRARWYFAYVNDRATGDHFATLSEFKQWTDTPHPALERTQ